MSAYERLISDPFAQFFIGVGAVVVILALIAVTVVVLIYLAAGVMTLYRRWQGEAPPGQPRSYHCDRPLAACGFRHYGACTPWCGER